MKKEKVMEVLELGEHVGPSKNAGDGGDRGRAESGGRGGGGEVLEEAPCERRVLRVSTDEEDYVGDGRADGGGGGGHRPSSGPVRFRAGEGLFEFPIVPSIVRTKTPYLN